MGNTDKLPIEVQEIISKYLTEWDGTEFPKELSTFSKGERDRFNSFGKFFISIQPYIKETLLPPQLRKSCCLG